jgi:lactase-phlorizin hydrolase
MIITVNKMLNPQLGIYAHPIFSEEGDYPSVVKERVDANSKAEGFTTSRLPKFTSEEVNFIKGKIRFSSKVRFGLLQK